MPINSKQKGSRGERDLAKWLRDNLGVKARRGQQYEGSSNSPDVVGIAGLHLECKRTQTFNAYKAMDKAATECGDNIPVIAHKKNHKEWLLVIRAEDLIGLANCIYNLLRPESPDTLKVLALTQRTVEDDSRKPSDAHGTLSTFDCTEPPLLVDKPSLHKKKG